MIWEGEVLTRLHSLRTPFTIAIAVFEWEVFWRRGTRILAAPAKTRTVILISLHRSMSRSLPCFGSFKRPFVRIIGSEVLLSLVVRRGAISFSKMTFIYSPPMLAAPWRSKFARMCLRWEWRICFMSPVTRSLRFYNLLQTCLTLSFFTSAVTRFRWHQALFVCLRTSPIYFSKCSRSPSPIDTSWYWGGS